MKSCCKITKMTKKCKRKDGKVFYLPRKFTRKQCINPKGFTMRSSCAPYKMCGGSAKKTRNVKKIKKIKCVAVLSPDKTIKNNNVNGIVYFNQRSDKLEIIYNISNLENGKHGFHIHECGDLTKGCSSGCSHFNPYNKHHGSLNKKNSHAGDLGNIKSKNNISKGKITTNKISIKPCNINSIIGRMVIVHKDEDDLGKENNEESKKTGNAGKRLACGVIGITN